MTKGGAAVRATIDKPAGGQTAASGGLALVEIREYGNRMTVGPLEDWQVRVLTGVLDTQIARESARRGGRAAGLSYTVQPIGGGQ